MIYIYLLFVIYSSIAGSVEAILYGKKGAETFKWNEHVLFISNAGVVLAGLLIAQYIPELNIVEKVLSLAICICSYPFFHDGFYYETAKRINRPDYKFSSNSKTSTAHIEIPWFFRFNLFIASVIVYLAYNLLY